MGVDEIGRKMSTEKGAWDRTLRVTVIKEG